MTTDPTRWLWALAALALWLVLVGITVWSVRRARRIERARSLALVGGAPEDAVLVAYASQTGFAEELAWMTARALGDAGWGARVVSFTDLDLAALTSARRALFIVSTTGEGDAPDSAARVLRTLLSSDAPLSDLSYGLLALGDRTYRDYCAFGHAVDGWLQRASASRLFDRVEVDDADPAAICHWQHHLNQLTGAVTAPDWTPPAYQAWRLVERRLLNPGSPGGQAWALALAPIDHSPDWVAGDIAEIGVPGPDGADTAGHREYSVASLPADGRVELLVRLMTHPDGTPGLASGWLTQTAEVGSEVAMRVRPNRGFHSPDAQTPLILIGNGTGLAGLRAHLKARAATNTHAGSWLVFGERTAAHDAFYDDDLQAWLASGALTRLDRCFSRDANDGRYVQDLITEHAATLSDWVERGAALYVCGSLEGMASGVHSALETALGPDRLTTLTETARYRRDVY